MLFPISPSQGPHLLPSTPSACVWVVPKPPSREPDSSPISIPGFQLLRSHQLRQSTTISNPAMPLPPQNQALPTWPVSGDGAPCPAPHLSAVSGSISSLSSVSKPSLAPHFLHLTCPHGAARSEVDGQPPNSCWVGVSGRVPAQGNVSLS